MADDDDLNEFGWTREEMFNLLQGLKAFGSHDVERLHESVATKSPEEIVLVVNHYKKIASQHPVFKQKPNNPKKNNKPHVPLASWAKKLTDSIPLEELKTETSTAVRMIAELEVFPAPSTVGGIDFRKIYHAIADALEGKPIQADEITLAVLHKCIVETAMAGKAFMKPSVFKHFINSVNLDDREMHSFPKLTENQELAVLRHLASQKNYNPLKVPENYLKPSGDKDSDKPETSQHHDKPGPSQYHKKPEASQHHDKPGPSQYHKKPGTSQFNDKPGASRNPNMPGTSQFPEMPETSRNSNMPGTSQYPIKPETMEYSDQSD